MCAGSTITILARWPAPELRSCTPPLHPPGLWLFQGIEPFQSQRPYRRSSTLGRHRSPEPIDQGAFVPLWNPDQPCADWMPPSSRRWTTIKGPIAAP